MPQPQQHQIQVTSVTHITDSYWDQPGIKPASSQRHQVLNLLHHTGTPANYILDVTKHICQLSETMILTYKSHVYFERSKSKQYLKKKNLFSDSCISHVLVLTSSWSKLDLREMALTIWSPRMDGTTQTEMEILTEETGIWKCKGN